MTYILPGKRGGDENGKRGGERNEEDGPRGKRAGEKQSAQSAFFNEPLTLSINTHKLNMHFMFNQTGIKNISHRKDSGWHLSGKTNQQPTAKEINMKLASHANRHEVHSSTSSLMMQGLTNHSGYGAGVEMMKKQPSGPAKTRHSPECPYPNSPTLMDHHLYSKATCEISL